MKLDELNEIENRLIGKYKKEVEKIISGMSDTEFKKLLLQRRFSSYAFTPLYDFGIDGMKNEKAKKIMREIRNEEYPAGLPSHREDLVHDLMAVGISLKEIINSEPTPETLKSIKTQLDFLKINETQELHDIKVVAFLRFALEILVSAEYEIFIKRLEKFGMDRKNSRFYWPHYEHDMKKSPFGIQGKTHSDMLSQILAEMIDSDEKIRFYKDAIEESYNLRFKIFRQF